MKDVGKKRVAEKAKDFLFTKTPEEITMIMVANAIDMTAPTLYHYFKDGKKELIKYACDEIENEITNLVSIKMPSSLKPEMALLTYTSIIGDYMMKSKMPVSFLIEDPKDIPLKLENFRNKIKEIVKEMVKDKAVEKTSADQATGRYLAVLAADINHYKTKGKELPENFSEKVVQILKK